MTNELLCSILRTKILLITTVAIALYVRMILGKLVRTAEQISSKSVSIAKETNI